MEILVQSVLFAFILFAFFARQPVSILFSRMSTSGSPSDALIGQYYIFYCLCTKRRVCAHAHFKILFDLREIIRHLFRCRAAYSHLFTAYKTTISYFFANKDLFTILFTRIINRSAPLYFKLSWIESINQYCTKIGIYQQ